MSTNLRHAFFLIVGIAAFFLTWPHAFEWMRQGGNIFNPIQFFADAINAGGVLCGSPEQIIEHLKALEKRYPGLDRISVSLSVGVPKSACLEQLERFATEIMPAFAGAKVREPALA